MEKPGIGRQKTNFIFLFSYFISQMHSFKINIAFRLKRNESNRKHWNYSGWKREITFFWSKIWFLCLETIFWGIHYRLKKQLYTICFSMMYTLHWNKYLFGKTWFCAINIIGFAWFLHGLTLPNKYETSAVRRISILISNPTHQRFSISSFFPECRTAHQVLDNSLK